MSDLNLAMVGNCTFGALIDPSGRIVWCCFPRFDSDPIFNSLLNRDSPYSGFQDILIENYDRCEQSYTNSNSLVLRTVLHSKDGSAVEIVDFAPHFKLFGRTYKPSMLIRKITPIKGEPRVCIRCRPTFEYNSIYPDITNGSNHIRFCSTSFALRLTTDVPVSYVMNEITFTLEDSKHLFFSTDESLSRPLIDIFNEFFQNTTTYWKEWTKLLNLPFEWQLDITRAALLLRLNCFEESGAIIAAQTTSIPEMKSKYESPNFDPRYSWIKDSHLLTTTLSKLCEIRALDNYLSYLNNIVRNSYSVGETLSKSNRLQFGKRIDEKEAGFLAGYQGIGPVMIGQPIYTRSQDCYNVYGVIILALSSTFFDSRLNLYHKANENSFFILAKLAKDAYRTYNKSIIEMRQLYLEISEAETKDPLLEKFKLESQIDRDNPQYELYVSLYGVHTISAVYCWAGIRRMVTVAKILLSREKNKDAAVVEKLKKKIEKYTARAEEVKEYIETEAWNPDKKCYSAYIHGESTRSLIGDRPNDLFNTPDTSVLKLAELGYLSCDDEKFKTTVKAFEAKSEFDLNTEQMFCYINAIYDLGQKDRARELFETLMACRNPAGMFSSSVDLTQKESWGNLPDTVSLAYFITTAFKLSKSWDDAW